MKRNRILIPIVVVVLFIIAFLHGEITTTVNKTQISDISTVSEKIKAQPKLTAPAQSLEPTQNTAATQGHKQTKEAVASPDDIKSTQEAEETVTYMPKTSEKPTLAAEITPETEKTPTEEKELTCSLSVSCAEVLDNVDKLADGKSELIPKDGIIYPEQTVVFYEGESVFNVLLREMKKNKIHLEFVDTPMYNSTYIEGIGNLYEFDCSDLSGWRFKVNGKFVNYSCSKYEVCDGDRIEWVYTCDYRSENK